MKKAVYCLLLVFCILLVSCSTTTYDIINSLQPNDYSIPQRLPNLRILSDETAITSGSSEKVSTSSYLFTIFRRELSSNILDDISTEEKGSIEMVLTYCGYQTGLVFGKATIGLEFDINIYNKDGKIIWTKTYFEQDNRYLHSYTYSEMEPALIEIEHSLLDKFKDDVITDYSRIINSL